MILALALPFLLVKATQPMLLTQNEYTQLIPAAQAFVTHYFKRLTYCMYWGLTITQIALFGSGALIAKYGVYNWYHKVQAPVDDTAEGTAAKIRLEVNQLANVLPLTNQETEEPAEEAGLLASIPEDTSSRLTAGEPEAQGAATIEPAAAREPEKAGRADTELDRTRTDRRQEFERRREHKHRIVNALAHALQDVYQILEQRGIGDTKIDLVLAGSDMTKSDYLVDVIVLGDSPMSAFLRVRDAARELAIAALKYQELTNREAATLLLVAYQHQPERQWNWSTRIARSLPARLAPRILEATLSQFDEFSVDDWRQAIISISDAPMGCPPI